MDDFVLIPEEDVYFKHSCAYNKVSGVLYVTNLRLAWLPSSNGAQNILKSATDVLKDQYSPPSEQKSMLRISRITTKQPAIFVLEGADPSSCRKELERLKAIMKNMKSLATSVDGKCGGLPYAQDNRISTSNINSNAVSRNAILEADKQLQLQYKELVLEKKIIDEEDFWRFRDNVGSDKEILQASRNQGMLTNLLSGMVRLYNIFVLKLMKFNKSKISKRVTKMASKN